MEPPARMEAPACMGGRHAVRIVGGQWRGRALAAPGSDAIRPTTDRARETLFNILAHDPDVALEGARVLDLFAGTGALGFEALSRGADMLTCIESGRKALAVLRQNAALLSAAPRIVARDARRPGPGTPHDLIFLDPPYGMGLGEAAIAALHAEGWIAPGATIVWEEGRTPTLPDFLRRTDERRYGDTRVTFAEAA